MNTSIATQLREARIHKGLTQEELAELSRVSLRTIQRVELGQVVPRSSTLELLTAVLDIKVALENGNKKDSNKSIKLLKVMNFMIVLSLPIPLCNILISVGFLILFWKQQLAKTPVKHALSFQSLWTVASMTLFFLGIFISNLLTENAGNGLYVGLIIYALCAIYNIYVLLRHTLGLDRGRTEVSPLVPNFF